MLFLFLFCTMFFELFTTLGQVRGCPRLKVVGVLVWVSPLTQSLELKCGPI
jgi:hypothetical protein